MDKIYDIFLGRCGGWHTQRVMHNANEEDLQRWLQYGYRVETEHQIGSRLHEVYLVKL